MTTENLPNPHSVLCPLSEQFNTVLRLPADNEYSSYEAMLELPTPLKGENLSQRTQRFCDEFSEFVENCLLGGFWFNTYSEDIPCDQVRIILHYHDDLLKVYNHYHRNVVSVTGPLDAQHVHFLKSDNHSVDCSDKLYYNKYPCKLTVRVGWNLSTLDSKQQLNDIDGLVDANVDQYRRYRNTGYYTRDVYYYLDVESAQVLLPLLSLGMSGSVSYHITVRKTPIAAQVPEQLLLFPDK